jgi:hypothetical protein
VKRPTPVVNVAVGDSASATEESGGFGGETDGRGECLRIGVVVAVSRGLLARSDVAMWIQQSMQGMVPRERERT